MTNKSNRVLYVGVTNDIHRRITEHRLGINDGFSKRYSITKLVYCEHYLSAQDAIEREKQIKGWVRKKKNNLIETLNPNWNDLSEQYEII